MTSLFIFDIRVRANSSHNKVGGTSGNPARLVVAVQAPAVDGKANSAILKLLAKSFGLKTRDFKILMGETSRDKRIQAIGDTAYVCNSYEALCGN